MPATKETLTEKGFLGEIYKATKMGASSIIDLLPHVKSDALRSVMTMQLDGYEKYAARAERELEAHKAPAKEEGLVTRLSARAGIALQTMLDSSPSHMAEMLIEGVNMDITEMTRLLNSFDARNTESEAVRLALELVRFEEHNLELLKRHL